VATVPAGEPSRFATPRNAGVARFVPYAASLRRAVCAVTHGGMGATQTALTHRFPACVVPLGREQLDVARRVEIAQAGEPVTRAPAAPRPTTRQHPPSHQRHRRSRFRPSGGAVRWVHELDLDRFALNHRWLGFVFRT
jgi:hypothetical protein